MSVYRKEYTLLSSDVDAARRLRLSRLFTMLQEASIAHTTALGMGREKTLDKGLLWIIVQMSVQVKRLPLYDEKVRLLSWPGKTLHLYFPRFYRLEDENGECLLEGSALWGLMDQATRHIIFPEEHGIRIRAEKGRDCADRIIRRVADVLRNSFRSSDNVCRLQEDEFVIIMSRMTGTMHSLALEKIGQINEILKNPPEGEEPISLSVGVAFSDRDNPKGDVFEDADTALQRMKQMRQTGCAVY